MVSFFSIFFFYSFSFFTSLRLSSLDLNCVYWYSSNRLHKLMDYAFLPLCFKRCNIQSCLNVSVLWVFLSSLKIKFLYWWTSNLLLYMTVFCSLLFIKISYYCCKKCCGIHLSWMRLICAYIIFSHNCSFENLLLALADNGSTFKIIF